MWYLILADAADAANKDGSWLGIIFTGAVGGLAALAGQAVLERFGIVHKFKEHLWQKQLEGYQQFVVASHNVLVSLSSLDRSKEAVVEAVNNLVTEGRRLLVVASPLVGETAVEVIAVANEIRNEVVDSPKHQTTRETLKRYAEAQRKSFASIRTDLGIDALQLFPEFWLLNDPEKMYQRLENKRQQDPTASE